MIGVFLLIFSRLVFIKVVCLKIIGCREISDFFYGYNLTAYVISLRHHEDVAVANQWG